MTSLLGSELQVIVYAYLLAGIPVAGVWLAGRASPLYRTERWQLPRWWSRMALLVVLSAVAVARI
jgi:hypothetical protein